MKDEADGQYLNAEKQMLLEIESANKQIRVKSSV